MFLFHKNDKAQNVHTDADTLFESQQTYNQDGGWIVKIFYCTTERLVYIGREGRSKVKILILKKE